MLYASTGLEALTAATSSLIVTVAALAIALGRVRERLAKLEEWVRQAEREEG